MQVLARELWPQLRRSFGSGRIGLLIAPHVLNTGVGEWWVDRWPLPRASMLFVGGNLALQGDCEAVDPGFIAAIVAQRLRSWDRILIEVNGDWERIALAVVAPLQRWPRVILRLRMQRSPLEEATAVMFRRLGPGDADALLTLSASIQWIGDTWGGLAELARSGRAWAAWSDGRPASVAAPGFVGDIVEDISVVTEPQFRGRGLSTACAALVMNDIARGGKEPIWTTWPANAASLRVAEKLGFAKSHEDHAWIAGQPL